MESRLIIFTTCMSMDFWTVDLLMTFDIHGIVFVIEI